MINFVDPESEGPEADAGFIVELGELGTVTQTKPIIVDFMDLYDGNPYSHQEGIEYYRVNIFASHTLHYIPLRIDKAIEFFATRWNNISIYNKLCFLLSSSYSSTL